MPTAPSVKEKELQALLSEFDIACGYLHSSACALEDRVDWILSSELEPKAEKEEFQRDEAAIPDCFLDQMRTHLENIKGCTKRLDRLAERL